MIYSVILNLFVAHLLGDFYLQWPKMCNNKITRNQKGWGLWTHAAIVGILSGFALYDAAAIWQMIVMTILTAVAHGLIDWSKSYLLVRNQICEIEGECVKAGPESRKRIRYFIVDQIVHLGFIVGFAYLWLRMTPDWTEFAWLQTYVEQHPVRVYTAIGLMLMIRPANILILDIFASYRINGDAQPERRATQSVANSTANSSTATENDTNAAANGAHATENGAHVADQAENREETCEEGHGNFHSGALIGYTERALMLIFVVLSQYEAIGLLIAAKSILRFSEASSGNEKSEYVLSGTLLSLLLAVITGLLILQLPAV